MRRSFRPLLALALLLAGASAPLAQREAGGLPPSRDPRLARRLARAVPLRRLEPPDVAWLRAEDAAREKGAPLRYGVVQPLADSCGDAGLWEPLPDGGRVWRLRVSSPGALSLGLVLRRFQLPPGGELYVSDGAGSVVRGAYTSDHHLPGGGFAVQPVPGDTLALELREPPGAAPAEVVLAGVVHDYAGVLDGLERAAAGAGGGGSCEVDVACPEGAGWQDASDAVVRILAGGFLCSGALVANTSGDGAQLLLTAEHCGDLERAVFFFRYQRAECGAGDPGAAGTVQGSVALARSAALDVQLVRLTEPIPPAYGAYLAGWDRSGTVPPATRTIHHPGGGPKRISFDDDPPRRSGVRWRVRRWERGVTEPGSSGAPLFTPEGALIGQLCCGLATCSYPHDDDFGRLDAAWTLLAPWLDPARSGAARCPGRRLAAAPSPLAIERVEPASQVALVPGRAQTVTLRGSGFAPDAQVLAGGVALARERFTVVDERTITLDLPQLAALGRHALRVRSGGEDASAEVEIVAPAVPVLEVGDGEPAPANRVRAGDGLALVLGGPPGQAQVVVFSLSDRPSVAPGVALCLGDGFTDLGLACAADVGPAGWSALHLPLPPLALELFLQSLAVGAGLPLASSGCQSVAVVP